MKREKNERTLLNTMSRQLAIIQFVVQNKIMDTKRKQHTQKPQNIGYDKDEKYMRPKMEIMTIIIIIIINRSLTEC